MHLATRLTTTSALVGLVVFGAYGAWLVHTERRDLDRAVDREVSFLATSLRVGVENALRDDQAADVLETILRLDELDARVDVLVLRPDGSPWVAATEPLTEAEAEAVARVAREVSATHLPHTFRAPSHPEMLVHGAPLHAEDATLLGLLVVLRPLSDVKEDLGDTLGLVTMTVGLFILLAGGFGGLLSRVFLARPLARLLEGIRAVRSGTTLQPLPEEGDFEVASLATEFNQMTRDLAAAREAVVQESEARRVAQQALQAADRLVTVGQLSAALAHEIGSPLQVLHGRARALAERPMEPAQVQANAQILVRESERISRIVSQTLSLARRRPLRRIRFDLSAVAREVAHVMESEARRRRIHLERAWDPEAVEMMGDPDQLQQVALNLLLNALHATPPGGHVRIGTRQGTSQAILFVEDDGEGMDEETATRAFEPLFTTHAEQGGTGLGLAVVKALVEEHGGRVTLRTEKGRGSLFSIEIPTPGEEPA